MNVFFANGGKAITAVIDKVAFRKYWAKPYKDKETGKMVKRQVYAIKAFAKSFYRLIHPLSGRDIPYSWLSA